MRILISGASGLVGRHLSAAAQAQGHQVAALGRGDFLQGADFLAERLAEADAVVHLAGEPINRRWSAKWKQQIYSSRITTTEQLAEAFKRCSQRPKVFASTSAIGAFQDGAIRVESDEPDAVDFLGKVSFDWERAAQPVSALGVRTLILRFGLVLARDGGLLPPLLRPFRLGLGGPIGNGKQGFSWIHIDDLKHLILHLLTSECEGVFHACAPNPTSNRQFSTLMGRVLNRPAFIPVAPLMLKALYGEGADVMTAGQWVKSERLPQCGFQFSYSELEVALRQLLER